MRTWTAWPPSHGFQVFWLGFLARADSYEMGVPVGAAGASCIPPSAGSAWATCGMHLRRAGGAHGRGRLRGGGRAAYRATTTFARCLSSAWRRVGLPAPRLEHSPITGVHLWFDREVTTLPHATLLDRTMQWMFNKDGGRYLQLVVSASRELTGLLTRPRSSIWPWAICGCTSRGCSMPTW